MLFGTHQMITKTENMISQQSLNVILNDTVLERAVKTKFLGVILDENLSWKYHIEGISKTISRNIGIINKLKHFIPDRILYSLYCTLVLPYVNYGILVWGNACKMYLDKLLKLQKWALRTISNSHYRCHSAPLFVKYNILNVYDCYKLELGVFMFKYYTNQLPPAFNNFFQKRSTIHDYHTRNCSNYNQTRNKKTFSDHSVRTSGVILWNSFQETLKTQMSTKSFRTLYKSQLICLYN